MSRKNRSLLIRLSSFVIVIVLILVVYFIRESVRKDKSRNNNRFTAGGISVETTTPDSVVPTLESLVSNLEDAGYTVNEYETALDSDIEAKRVYAKTGEEFIDICYGLTEDNASKVFKNYEETYGKDYYLLALNGTYVYCISDKKTFEKSGFTSTANIGIQYLNEGK